HAPYSVHPELLQHVVRMSAADGFPIAMHLAESREEIELLGSRSGRFVDFLRQLGVWEPDNFPPNGRPLDYLEALAEAHRALVVHGNYLDDEEIAFLARRADRMAVVYCPRTHAYFQHPQHPLGKLLAAGATVALGTDGRASSPDLSVLAEMRFIARKCPSISPDTVLRLGTILGARALGLDHRLGTLEPGKQADLAVIALPDRESPDPHELLFDSDLSVIGGVVSGEWWGMSDA
ncbi:MAG: amidohydrolase family protein, partial [Planctomycetes bacterium]|nr:amidohydrolase family protein [Planctomycetota bacterium]